MSILQAEELLCKTIISPEPSIRLFPQNDSTFLREFNYCRREPSLVCNNSFYFRQNPMLFNNVSQITLQSRQTTPFDLKSKPFFPKDSLLAKKASAKHNLSGKKICNQSSFSLRAENQNRVVHVACFKCFSVISPQSQVNTKKTKPKKRSDTKILFLQKSATLTIEPKHGKNNGKLTESILKPSIEENKAVTIEKTTASYSILSQKHGSALSFSNLKVETGFYSLFGFLLILLFFVIYSKFN